MQSFLPRFRIFKNALEIEYKHLPSSEAGNALDVASTRWKQRFYALVIVYIATVLCGIGAFLVESNSSTAKERTLPTDAIFGDIRREQVLFVPNQTYADVFPGSEVTEQERLTLWDALQPRGGGFIAVSDPRTYGLVGGLPLENDNEADTVEREGYGVSMFHQIHCLVAIRNAFQTGNFTDKHMDHCFDYLRQAIMCQGDTTLEKVVIDEKGHFKPEIDGWYTTHQCRSYNMLFDFAESRRVKVIGD